LVFEADLAHLNRVSMLGELAASVAHELKQPMAAAALHAETCLQWLRREHPDLHAAGEAAARILADANRAEETIDRLRSLYKKSTPKRELVDVDQTIRQMVALLLGEATRHAVSIRMELAVGLKKSWQIGCNCSRSS
jgi:C4-dicarboxylate-specific signal transduction histidine kinase